MGKPIAIKKAGNLCFAFPNVCDTQVGTSTQPMPYPSLGDLGKADGESENVYVQGIAVILKDSSKIPSSTGDEPGLQGTKSVEPVGGEITFASASQSVYVNNEPVVRMSDSTWQNNRNARGTVTLGDPTVLVGD